MSDHFSGKNKVSCMPKHDVARHIMYRDNAHNLLSKYLMDPYYYAAHHV